MSFKKQYLLVQQQRLHVNSLQNNMANLRRQIDTLDKRLEDENYRLGELEDKLLEMEQDPEIELALPNQGPHPVIWAGKIFCLTKGILKDGQPPNLPC